MIMKELLKNQLAKFLIAFFILFIIVFIVLNLTGWLIKPKSLDISSDTIIDKKEAGKSKTSAVSNETKCVFSEKPNSILIPKIEIEAPLIFSETPSNDLIDELNRGVAHYPESDLPGEQGETIFLGHSAPLWWPKTRYGWIFTDLKNLESGDEIYIFFKNCEYIYIVSEKYFLDRGQELPDLTNSKSVLVLISCWPPGKDTKRIAVRAELEKNVKK